MSAIKIITWTVIALIVVGSLLGRKQQNEKILDTLQDKFGETKDFVTDLIHKV